MYYFYDTIFLMKSQAIVMKAGAEKQDVCLYRICAFYTICLQNYERTTETAKNRRLLNLNFFDFF